MRTGLGECRFALFQPAAAETALAEAVRIAARTTGRNRLDHLQTRLRLARVIAGRGRSAEALAELGAVLDLAQAPETADPFCALTALIELGNAQAEAGLVDAALATLERAVARADELRPNAPQAALARERLGLALLAAHRADDALAVVDRAEAIRRALGAPPDSPTWLAIAHVRVRADLQRQRWDAARSLLERPEVWRGGALRELPALRTRILALQAAVGAADLGAATGHVTALQAWADAQAPEDELPHLQTDIDLAAGELAWQRGQTAQARACWERAQQRIERTALGPQAGWRMLCDTLARCGQPPPTEPRFAGAPPHAAIPS